MSFPFLLRLRAEWKRWKGHWRTVARAGRRNPKPRAECLEARALLASITEYPITVGTPFPGSYVSLFGVTGRPDGNVYFADLLNNAIGRATPSGVITEMPLPPPPVTGSFFKNGLYGITLGADNKLAFTEETQGVIGKITASGSYNQY